MPEEQKPVERPLPPRNNPRDNPGYRENGYAPPPPPPTPKSDRDDKK